MAPPSPFVGLLRPQPHPNIPTPIPRCYNIQFPAPLPPGRPSPRPYRAFPLYICRGWGWFLLSFLPGLPSLPLFEFQALSILK